MSLSVTSRFARSRRQAICLALLVASIALVVPVSAQPRGFRLEGLKGGELVTGDLDQGTTVAIVWASWSPRCRDIVERTNAIAARWGKQVRVITVDFQEDPEAVRSFLKGQDLKAPVYMDEDGAFSKKYAVTHLPGLLVFRDGQIRFSGRLSRDPDSVISESLQ